MNATEFLNLKLIYDRAAIDMEDLLTKILKLNDMFVEDIIFDTYDTSFEFHGIEEHSYRCTPEQLTQIFMLGFDKFWIVFDDHSEIEYLKSMPTFCFLKDSSKILIRKELVKPSEIVDSKKINKLEKFFLSFINN